MSNLYLDVGCSAVHLGGKTCYTRFFFISNAFFRLRLKCCLTKSQIFRNLALPYLTKRFLKCYLEWVQSFCIGHDHWFAIFFKICLSHRANFSLVLLIKVLLIKEKACILMDYRVNGPFFASSSHHIYRVLFKT